jgi:hypothetical protein
MQYGFLENSFGWRFMFLVAWSGLVVVLCPAVLEITKNRR